MKIQRNNAISDKQLSTCNKIFTVEQGANVNLISFLTALIIFYQHLHFTWIIYQFYGLFWHINIAYPKAKLILSPYVTDYKYKEYNTAFQ